MKSKMKLLLTFVLTLALCFPVTSSLACTSIYVGSELTTDGSTILARSEDISNSYNKVYFVSPAGNHAAGETYNGCYGFTWTFTKDSYAYTCFSDDNGAGVDNVCPDCGGTHAHTPYGAAGTNEKGVSVSATETINSASALREVDPYTDLGIEESEITTVLLSEAATAREAVDLLLSIYDAVGCAGGSGIMIADSNEAWYLENTTGHEYLAVKLSSSMVFTQPNMVIIGLVDLDDTENVIASANLIAVAKQAGTYVGDEAANTIDYLASYNPTQKANGRMVDSLKFFNAATAPEAPVAADYTISNVDAEGSIVPFYTNIVLDHTYSIEDLVAYYHIPSIGYNRNLETHIFQIFAQDGPTDTVEWVAMDDAHYSVFVPYYPMLTTDTYAGYKLGTAAAQFTVDQPDEASVAYATTKYQRNENGERVPVAGYTVLPENWADSFYWTYDALSNLIEAGKADEAQMKNIEDKLAEMQSQCYAVYDQLKQAVAEAGENAAEVATQISAEAAAAVHAAGVEMVNAIK